jgi:hypothetical protein
VYPVSSTERAVFAHALCYLEKTSSPSWTVQSSGLVGVEVSLMMYYGPSTSVLREPMRPWSAAMLAFSTDWTPFRKIGPDQCSGSPQTSS